MKESVKTIRLILGDQLNEKHSWFITRDPEVLYVMAELRQETDYVTHHIQKLIGFFLAMRYFSQHLGKMGHRVKYYNLDDTDNTGDLSGLIRDLISSTGAVRFEYQLPDEFRLDQQLKDLCSSLSVETACTDLSIF